MDQELTPFPEESGEDLTGFTEVKSKKSKRARRSVESQGANSDEESGTNSNISKKNRRDEVKPNIDEQQQDQHQHQQVRRGEREAGSSENEMEATQGESRRLVFPQDCRLTVQEKVLWTVQLAQEHRSFSPVYREGKNRPFVSVRGQEAVDLLTGEGYKGVKLQVPDAGQQVTKIIIFRFPLYLDPDLVLDEPRIEWAHRHKVRGEERSQVVALIKGAAPSKLFITGIGYKPVARYIEEPPFCLRCSRWGHLSWKCQTDPRCRFCSRNHDSSVCGTKIREQTRIVPRCVNCRGAHNARSMACPVHPRRKAMASDPAPHRSPPDPSPEPWRPGISDPPPSRNAWERGRPAIPGEDPRQGEEGGEASRQPANPAASTDLSGHASLPTTTSTTTPLSASASDATPPPVCHSSAAANRGDEALYDLVTKLCEKIDHLENEVRELKKNGTHSESEKSVAEVNHGNKGSSECKVKINGQQKIVKTHKVITSGVEGIERLLRKCRGDESKKAKVFEGWKEVHRNLDKFAREMEGITGIAMDMIEVHE